MLCGWSKINDKKIGIISSGVAYQYAKDVFGDKASYLKLGFTYPLPMEKIKEFSEQVETLYVIEETEPYIEEQMKEVGIDCIGKEKIPNMGELMPEVLSKVLLDAEMVDNLFSFSTYLTFPFGKRFDIASTIICLVALFFLPPT